MKAAKAMRTMMASAVAVGLASCTAYQQQGALIGGLAGAGLGAAFGDDHQDVVAGAAVGAGLGAGAAAAHENAVRQRGASHPAPRQQGPPPSNNGGNEPPTRPAPEEYPRAQRTTTPGEVLSPYPPHNRIDVSGFRSGQLVKDPETGEIFRVP